jgi:hypothetical protein
MAKTTIKELEAKVNSMEEKMNSIDEKLNSIINRLEGTTSTPKSSPKKTEGKVKNSKKATTCKYEVVEGQGKGQGKKFVQIIFDGKPSDKVLESLKSNGFKYFAPTKVWSTLHTDAKVKFAESLIK